jgi:serine/threonine-protein kinase
MQAERWRQVDQLFDAALEREPSERAAFLDEACAGDDALRREVESLLAAHERAGSFIEMPASDSSAGLVTKEKTCLTVGRRIGHYEVISRLGAGGMGEVYLARDTRLTRNIAIKLLPASVTADERARARFLREAQLAATLDHPNICTVHEIGEDAEQWFIAMQYVEGKTLKDVMAGQPLGIKSLLAISLQAADALSAAHNKGIVHRDIKSTNIIITPRGQVKVVDFGLAKLMDKDAVSADWAGAELTQTGVILGTPAYMSPEQARGEPADHRGDIFSFGVLMYEMATGQLPFMAKSQPETLNAIINEPQRPVSELNKEVTPELSAIIDRAMAKDPASRYQSMQELLAALWQVAREMGFSGSSLLDGVPQSYFTHDHGWRSSRIKRWLGTSYKRKIRLAGLGAFVLTLTITGVLWLSRTGRMTNAAAIDSLAVMPMVNASSNAEVEYLSDGITDTVINNLSRLSNLKVMSHSSVFRYKGKEIDPQAAARDLSVQAVVTGQVLLHGENLTISIELVDGRDDRQIWGERYNGKLADILQLQSNISRDISNRLRLKINGEEQKLIAKRYTASAEAYQLYLKARYFWSKMTEEGARKSIPYYNQALEQDPNYALAYSGLADAYNVLGISFARPRDVFPKAGQAALKALELDETLAEAHISMGAYKLFYEWDWAGAEREANRAKQLNPSYARAIELNTNYGEGPHFYCWYLDVIGNTDESIREISRALEIAPLSAMLHAELTWSYYSARQFDHAIEQGKSALEIDPGIDLTYLALANAYEQKGMYKEAIAELDKARNLPVYAVSIISELGYAYAMSGRQAEAKRVIQELKRRASLEYVDPTLVAYVYIGLGDKEQAFKWLDKAYEDRSPGLTWLRVEPKFDPLRADSRFIALLRRVGIP